MGDMFPDFDTVSAWFAEEGYGITDEFYNILSDILVSGE